jgi:hypothetical protein
VEAWTHGLHRSFTDVVLFGVIGGILLALTLEKQKQSAAPRNVSTLLGLTYYSRNTIVKR